MSVAGLKNAGGMAGGLVVLLVILAIPIILLTGAAEFSVWALDWIPGTIGIAITGCLVLLPLAVIPATRGFASSMYGLASFAFGVCLWLYALAFTYIEWGMVGVVIGVLVFGVGVVITGILAAIFSATWVVLWNIAFLFALFIVARILSAWLMGVHEERKLLRRIRETPSQAIVTPARPLTDTD